MNELNPLLTSDDYREHTEFWTERLELIEEDFRLRQNWQSYALPSDGAQLVVDLAVAKRASDLINELGRGKDTGVFVVVLAAVFHVLHVYSGAETLCADSPYLSSGDEQDGSVPLIFDYDGSLSVRAHLDRVRDLVAQSYTYQEFPLREFAAGTLDRNPPTSNVLVQSPGMHALIPVTVTGADYDLAINIDRDNGRLSVRLEGRKSVFSQQFLENFSRHLSRALAGLADLDAAIGTISLIDEAERHKLLEQWAWTRDEDRKLAANATVLDLFAEQVALAPEHSAIVTSEVEITYGDLDDKSTRLAQFLVSEFGVKGGDVIGVLSPRSELWVIALLGILKAGAVYLPLDPEYPEERLQFMMTDAEPRVLLIHSEYLSLVTELADTPMFALDLQLDELAPAPVSGRRASPDDVAYIIYTSGSTGQPKGVVLEHAGLANLVVHHVESFGFDATDRLTQFYAPSFDGSILEVFVALAAGGTLVMAPGEMIKDARQFSSYIAGQGVTTVNALPVYLAALDWENLPQVRRVISAGDQAKVETAQRLAQRLTYNNSYGPTEATVCAANYQVDPSITYGARIPVGRPLSNLAIYLLDDKLNLVPEGVVGEICISGIGLARGYLNRADLTAQAFVANPFAAGERLYRTGDLGVWLPDGNLELTGRKDTQVKVRGFRIELAEIEAQLLQPGEVNEAVVLVSEKQPGDKQLIAFVSGVAGLTGDTLRERLSATLPAYMVPANFVFLDRLPVNRNGKLDRRALAAMSLEPRARSAGYAPPENAVQETLVRIWSEVLGRDAVGIHDDFFELGGDSILVIQAVSSAHEAGLQHSTQQVFEHHTIAALANVVVDVQSAQQVRAEQGTLSGPLPLTPIQRWFFERNLQSRNHYNQSVMLEVPALVAPAVLEKALHLLIQHHDALRLRFVETGGVWEQFYAATEESSVFAVTDLSELPAASQDAAIKSEAARLQASLDLSHGPILRAQLFQGGAARPARFLVIIHHLAVDGVSWRILLEDFDAACRALQAGARAQFPPKTTSFRDWAMRLKELSESNSGNQDYWLNATRRQSSRVLLDYEAGPEANTVASQASATVALSEEATRNLLQEAPQAFNTHINDLLLTALLLTFQEWTGNAPLLVDLEGHGREDLIDGVDVSRTVGWFTSVYPLLLAAEPGAALTDTLKSVKEQIRAVPSRGIEYGIARYLSASQEYVEKLKSQPAAELVFNYLGQVDRLAGAEGDTKPLLDWESPEHAPDDPRSHVLEIEGVVLGSCLRLAWKYSRNLHARATIEQLANRYAAILQSLVDQCTNDQPGGFTPSDFPAARLDQETLNALIARIRG